MLKKTPPSRRAPRKEVLIKMTEDKIQQFLTWLLECEAKEDCKSIYVEDYTWYDTGKRDAFSYVLKMFKAAFREELQ